ncbi:acyltransferase [Desulfoplanes formicivorans]|uniref:Transferase n=1 Tax=Desulfoplanes formicivorans TaxID=1592317 RepID=A0A194ADT1_9BACT|nr:acyltransferase [Desulfoplanes formicivorans]GAU07360.1 transferase [Desulfoplanes formicivorans]
MEDTKVYGSDTGEGIPKKSFFEKISMYVQHVCGSKSLVFFVVQGMIFLVFKNFPTILGTYIRPFIYSIIFNKIDSGCLIESGVRFEIPKKITLGKNVFIGESCWVGTGTGEGNIEIGKNSFIAHRSTLAAQGGNLCIKEHVHVSRGSYINGIGNVTIGNDCMIGPNVVIISGTHNYNDVTIPIRKQGSTKKQIVIEDNVWLAANVNVMPGVTIGEGSVIGAGAVVTKDIPSYSIAVGVPARIIKNRKNDE